MRRRTRKFIGTIAMLIFVIIWALGVMMVAQMGVRTSHPLVEGLFYVIAGMGWVLPLMPLIKWMERPDPAP